MGHRTSGDIARDLDRQSKRLSGLKTAVQNIFRPGRESSSEGSNITLPLPRTGTVRNSNDIDEVGEFDLPALRKVRKEKERNDVKHGTFVAGFEGVQADPVPAHQPSPGSLAAVFNIQHLQNGSHETSDSRSSEPSAYTSASEGSEVEVDGGVALTEEAVETHTPDILAVPTSGEKNATVVQDVEMTDDEDGAEADIGLQSIMAQV